MGASVQQTVGHNSVQYIIVTNHEQMMDAMAIRAICHMEEEGVSARLAFDGNDFQATHILIVIDDEPVGAIRVRWFAEFAKLERMAIRKAYRHPRLIKSFAEFVFRHIARKGYELVITHAKPGYARLWRQVLKFEIIEGKEASYEGHPEPYMELRKKLEIPGNAISPASDAMLLFREEGRWDMPSKFEGVVK